MRARSGDVAIAGVGDTDYSRASKRSSADMAAQAVLGSLADARIDPSRVDGLIPVSTSVSADEMAAICGVRDLQLSATVPMGGSAPVAALRVASDAIRSGTAQVAVVYLSRNASSGQRIRARVERLPGQDFKSALERPFGWHTPAQWYSMICRRHMAEFGTTKRDLAEVAITMRRHANLNPRAMMYGRPLTLEDYQASEMISEPYQKLDCCLETDGAAAVVLTAADDAPRDRPTVRLAAVRSSLPDSPDDLTNRPDWLAIGLTKAAPRVWEEAGLGPSDMDGAMIYDCFTFEVLHQLEAAGFCPPGESGRFVRSGAISLGGRLPVNPHGGLLSEAHLAGLNHIVEAQRQLTGRCDRRQIDGARHLAVTGWGNLGDGALAVLERA